MIIKGLISCAVTAQLICHFVFASISKNPVFFMARLNSYTSIECFRSALMCILTLYLSRLVGKPTMWFLNRSDTNQAVQSQKQARSLKFQIEVEEELYYRKSKNKGADQLRGYREADLRLCFRLCRLLVFP